MPSRLSSVSLTPFVLWLPDLKSGVSPPFSVCFEQDEGLDLATQSAFWPPATSPEDTAVKEEGYYVENVQSEGSGPRKWPWVINVVLLGLVVWSLLKVYELRNPPPVSEGGVESGVIDSTLGSPTPAPTE